MSLQRIKAIAINVFREIVRENLLYFIVFYAILMVIAVILLPQVSLGNQSKILFDFGLAFTSLSSVFVAIFIGSGLLNKEIDKRTILSLLPKPISRTEIVFGKHIGLLFVQLVLIASMTLLLLVGLYIFKDTYNFTGILLAQSFLLLEVAILIAFALLFGSFTSSLLTALLTLGIYLAGHLSSDLFSLGRFGKNQTLINILHSLYLFLPDLERLNLKNRAFYGDHFEAPSLFLDLSYALIYTLVLLVISIVIFSRREF